MVAIVRPVSPEAHTSPLSPRRSPRGISLEERMDAARERMELGSSPNKAFTSPDRPSRRLLLASSPQKETPRRTLLAEGLQAQSLSGRTQKVIAAFNSRKATPMITLGTTPLPLEQVNPELVIVKAPITRSKSRDINRRELSDLITRCEAQFFECAKKHSSKATLSFGEFKAVFGVFRDLLLKLESKDFLDHYIVRDAQVGGNKDPLQQKAFEEFHDKILQLKDELTKIGVPSLEEGKSINFWSGIEGQQKAADDPLSFSDSDIPFFKFLFDCWGYIKNRELMRESPNPFLTSMLPNLFSAIFASHAKGEVNVYMSSKNDPTANSSIINIDSAFWGSELYHLTKNQDVTKVNLYLHIGKDAAGQDKWALPIDVKSHDPRVIAYRDSMIRISKRGDASLSVSMGTLKSVGLLWKEKAIKYHLLAGSDC